MPGAQMGMINLNEMLGKALGGARAKPRKMTVAQSYDVLVAEESDKLLDQEQRHQGGEGRGRAERHRLHRRNRQDLRPRRARAAPTSAARACSATCCR